MDNTKGFEKMWYAHTARHFLKKGRKCLKINCEAAFGQALLFCVDSVGSDGHCDVEAVSSNASMDMLENIIAKSSVFTVCPKDSKVKPGELRLAIHSQGADGTLQNYAICIEYCDLNYYSLTAKETPEQFCLRMLESIKQNGMFFLRCMPSKELQLTGNGWKRISK